MKRLGEIEGLRAYLALWVLIGHCMQLSGYSGQEWSGVLKLIRNANYAVDIFMLISGFVIFYLIDNRRETYPGYITRRFFRLWPLFMLTFIASIPLSLVALQNFTILQSRYPGAEVDSLINLYSQGWGNPIRHVLAHITMLHGAIPEQVLSGSPTAFLPPAWSISLEWQFYLIAPACYAALRSSNFHRTVFLLVACAGYILSNRFMHVHLNAFLPMHAEYFFFGCISYFIYKCAVGLCLKIRLFVVGVAISVFLLLMLRTLDLVPLCFWIPFCCLLIDQHNQRSNNFASRLFNNKVARYLGKISYSMYLSHILIIALVQYLILTFTEDVTQLMHFWILLPATLVLTVPVSSLLFFSVEVKGMEAGKGLALRWTQRGGHCLQAGSPANAPHNCGNRK